MQIKRRVTGPDRIEDHVERGKVAQGLQIILAHHTALGTQCFAVRQAFCRADTDPARVAERLAQLNGRRAHAAGAGMQQDLLAGTQRGQLIQIEPGRGINLRQGRRLGQRHPLRHGQGVTAINHHLLGHATACQQGANQVTHLPVAAGPDLDHHPGTLQAENVAGPGRWRIQTRTLQQVGAIQPGGRHPDANLPDITAQ